MASTEPTFKLDKTKMKTEIGFKGFLGTGTPGNIQQIQALRDCKAELISLLTGGELSIDPFKLLPTVCRALGESGTDAQLIAQSGCQPATA